MSIGLQTKPFSAICIHKLHFMTDTMWEITLAKQLRWYVFHLCFYSGQFQPSRRSRAPRHIDVCISVSWHTDEDASGPRRALWFPLNEVENSAGLSRLRPDCVDLLTPHNHQSQENDRLQTTDRSTCWIMHISHCEETWVCQHGREDIRV